MINQEIRKQFETWYKKEMCTTPSFIIICDDGFYDDFHEQSAWRGYLAGYQAALASNQCEISHLKFKIDSLMLEFCPSAMTQEQVENWAEHQKKINARIEQNIKKSVTTVAMREDLKDAVCFANDGKERDWTEQEHIDSNQEAHSDLKVAISALKELACLGNGDIYGNSIGNYIAIDALNLIKFN